jgi:hypothetical protein
MNRREWAKTALLIGFLLIAILFAQSRRNCEIPGSTWIPCIWGKALKQPGSSQRDDAASNCAQAKKHAVDRACRNLKQ